MATFEKQAQNSRLRYITTKPIHITWEESIVKRMDWGGHGRKDGSVEKWKDTNTERETVT
jgi:hypothetical protein